jgi:hypothetical protein
MNATPNVGVVGPDNFKIGLFLLHFLRTRDN